MAELTVTSSGAGFQNSAGQSSLQAPQQGLTNAVSAQAYQPGISGSQLVTGSGTAVTNPDLHGLKLSTVAVVSSGKAAPAPPKAHTNPALFGFSIVLFLIAIYLFWVTSKPSKKHNQ